MKAKEAEVIEAYLCYGFSQRKIQEDILGIDAHERGGGYEAWRILQSYGITGEHKSALQGKKFDPQAFEAAGSIRNYLRANP
jgi:hypothetical protein